MRKIRQLLKEERGENYIDVTVMVLIGMLILAFTLKVYPVYVAKANLDTFANELVREAEISGRVGAETTQRQRILEERTGLRPTVSWSRSGNIQLNEEVTVTVKIKKNIGLFSNFGSFPVELTAKATGKSERYFK
ncbi:MAG: DUF4320 family protein [[Clostridium] innocuum]|nr:DUF4320 family protein [[Clostridium] innocuum]MBS5685880.1 DUF4320 family protein [[Clostridium] innocuum]